MDYYYGIIIVFTDLKNGNPNTESYFPVWIEMVGKIDAFISLGNYACNNPGFVYPVISENEMFIFSQFGRSSADK